MLVALGWMLLAGLPCPAGSPEQLELHRWAGRERDAARVTVWTDREDPYRRGEWARVYLAAEAPAHVTVFRVDTDGRLRVLFPREPWGETFVSDTRTFEVRSERDGRSFIVDDFPGIGYLFAVASPHPFRYDDITRGDYWDYRAIDGGRLRGDPYVQLLDLAARITRRGEYDHSIFPYYVERRYEYPRFVCYDCHAYASYDRWDPYERACSRFRLVVYDDPGHYPYRYGDGRNVVTAARSIGPRYVFRDADPGSEYVTRLSRPGGDALHHRDEPGRTSQDLGGPGSVPAPAFQSLRRRATDPLGAVVDTPPAPVPERRREAGRRDRDREDVPEGLRPAEDRRRTAPSNRPPRSTGEPELRRRRP